MKIKRTVAHASLFMSASVVVMLAATPAFAEGKPIVVGSVSSQSNTHGVVPTGDSATTDDQAGATATTSSGTSASSNTSTTVHSQGTEPSDAVSPPHTGLKLTGPTLTLCNNRQAVINDIMGRIVNRGQQQVTLFGTIATRVEAFYTSSGKTVSGYTTLVAAINTAQTTAQSAVTTLKGAGTTFSCSTTDPQATITTFKADLQNEIAAVQAYRTAIKNLVQAILAVVSPSTSTVAGGNK